MICNILVSGVQWFCIYVYWEIIPTNVNIHMLTPYMVTKSFFFFVMRSFKVYSLSNFQRGHTILLTIVTMLCITSSWLLYFIIRSLYIFTSLKLFLPTPTCSWQSPICCLYLWGFFSISHISEIIRYLSFSDLFHLA